MEELHERIERAVEESGKTRKEFAETVARRGGGGGGTYRTLYNYITGKTEPSVRWLEAAAKVARVRVEWLRHGEGPIKDTDMEGGTSVEDEEIEKIPDPNALFDVCCRLRDGGGWLQQNATMLFRSSWWEAVVRIMESCPDFDDAEQNDFVAVGTFALGYAATVTKVSPLRRKWSFRDFHRTMVPIFQGLANAAPDAGQGRTLGELIDALPPVPTTGETNG